MPRENLSGSFCRVKAGLAKAAHSLPVAWAVAGCCLSYAVSIERMIAADHRSISAETERLGQESPCARAARLRAVERAKQSQAKAAEPTPIEPVPDASVPTSAVAQ